jgi:23S rRNA (adenine2503-C2)-methyltransferase
MKKTIKAIYVDDLISEMQRQGHKAFRAKQICQWLYKTLHTRSFDDMGNIPKDIRAWLTENYFFDSLTVEQVSEGSGGTKKILYKLRDDNFVESVLMPDNKKKDVLTLCVSSQVGCPLKCDFCLTARMGFIRDLTAAEMIDQVLVARREFVKGDQVLRNLVFMGMGEPLLNPDEVVRALEFLAAPQYCEISPRRITVSTAGIVPGIKKLGELTHDVNLAISLNATTNEVRERLMPVTKKYPIESLIKACEKFPLPKRRRITFEYVMLKDVNDTTADARRLIKILHPIRCKVNLIRFNPVKEIPYEPSTNEQIEKFSQVLLDKNYTVAIRYSKGQEIKAACGQLAATYLRDQS